MLFSTIVGLILWIIFHMFASANFVAIVYLIMFISAVMIFIHTWRLTKWKSS